MNIVYSTNLIVQLSLLMHKEVVTIKHRSVKYEK